MKTPSQYKVIIERDTDGFVASVPAIPGCYTQGDTYEELMVNVKDVIQLCLDVAKDDPEYRAEIAERAEEGSMVGMELVSV